MLRRGTERVVNEGGGLEAGVAAKMICAGGRDRDGGGSVEVEEGVGIGVPVGL